MPENETTDLQYEHVLNIETSSGQFTHITNEPGLPTASFSHNHNRNIAPAHNRDDCTHKI